LLSFGEEDSQERGEDRGVSGMESLEFCHRKFFMYPKKRTKQNRDR
jgi:hypothetical protein